MPKRGNRSQTKDVDSSPTCETEEQAVINIKKLEHHYELVEVPPSPLLFKSSNRQSNKFITFESALEFIVLHCFRVHGHYNRELCRIYMPQCLVYDKMQRKFVPMKNLYNRMFQTAFRHVTKTFEKISSLVSNNNN
jgi:hypothetical protein